MSSNLLTKLSPNNVLTFSLTSRSPELCSSINLIKHQKRFLNPRIVKSGMMKLERSFREVEKKVNEFKEFKEDPLSVRKVKKNVSNAIQIIEGKDVLRKKLEILNKNYLESISEIIANHSDFHKLSRLNINSIETHSNLLHIKIYWNFTEASNPSKIEEYNRILNSMIPDIRLNLQHHYFRNNTPEIKFYYDVYDGVNNQMEYLYSEVNKETEKLKKEPFDPAKLFEKEKLIKKEFDIKSLVLRDPSVDFPRDELCPTKFKHPYDMNLYAFNLDFKKIYEHILIQLSQGKSKRTLGRSTTKFNSDETVPSIYVEPPIFREDDLNDPLKANFEMPLTDDRIKLMKQFVIANKKKKQRESREFKRDKYEHQEDVFEKNLEAKQNLDEKYSEN